MSWIDFNYYIHKRGPAPRKEALRTIGILHWESPMGLSHGFEQGLAQISHDTADGLLKNFLGCSWQNDEQRAVELARQVECGRLCSEAGLLRLA